MKFFYSDYLKDTRILTYAERGLWMDILCYAHDHLEERGILRGTAEDLARLTGGTAEELAEMLPSLQRKAVGDIQCNGNVTPSVWIVCCRRIVREEAERARVRGAVAETRKSASVECNAKETECNANVTGIFQNPEARGQTPEEKKENPLSTQFVDEWNAMAARTNGKVRAIRGYRLNKDRADKLRARMKDAQWRDEYAEAIAKIPTCAQLMGKVVGAYWETKPVTVDWFLRAKVADSILEGAYDGKPKDVGSPRGGRSFEHGPDQEGKFDGIS